MSDVDTIPTETRRSEPRGALVVLLGIAAVAIAVFGHPVQSVAAAVILVSLVALFDGSPIASTVTYLMSQIARIRLPALRRWFGSE